MMVAQMAVYDEDRFTRTDRTLVTDASDLGFRATDQMPRSFAIRLPVSGRLVGCQYVDTIKDAEGDVQYWLYRPTVPILTIREVRIYND